MVSDYAFNHKIYYFDQVKTYPNCKGYHNCIIISKLNVILLNDWILSIDELYLEGSATNAATLSS